MQAGVPLTKGRQGSSFPNPRLQQSLINKEDADQFISQLIEMNEAGLVGRLGGTEARFIGEYLKLKRLQRFGIPLRLSASLSPRWKKRKLEVFAQAGFYFENWADVEQFCSEYLHALEITDILGAWGVAFTWPLFRRRSYPVFVHIFKNLW